MRGALAAVVGLACVGFASVTRAQAVVNPNQIAFDAHLVATNPDVRAVIDGSPAADWWCLATSSDGRDPTLHHQSSVSTPHRDAGAGQVTVETSVSGVPYLFELSQSMTPTSSRIEYAFAAVDVGLVAPEPAPDVAVSLSECAALIRIHWLDGLVPLTVTSATIEAVRDVGARQVTQARVIMKAAGDSAEILVRGDGQPMTLRVRYVTGTDVHSDLVTREWTQALAPACDEVIDVPHDCTTDAGSSGSGGGSGTGFGRIVGRVDLLGVDEHAICDDELMPAEDEWTGVRARLGPFGNMRWDWLERTPSEGDYELENLVPTDVVTPEAPYRVNATIASGLGANFQRITTASARIPVHAGETIDLGETLVIDPSPVTTQVTLSGPPAAAGGHAMMGEARWIDDPLLDADGDGIPDDPYSVAASRIDYLQMDVTGGIVNAFFHGALDDDGTLTGATTAWFGGLSRSSSRWLSPDLDLFLMGPDVPYVDLDVHETSAPMLDLVPAVPAARALDACVSEVHLQCLSTNAPFYRPSMHAEGEFDGIDYRGVPRTMRAYLIALGTPLDHADAATEGDIPFVANEGEWDFDVTAATINPGGGISTTQFDRVHASVGCRQKIALSSRIGIRMDDRAPCSQAGAATVSGSVTAGLPVARIDVTPVGGTTVVACADCGLNPTWIATVMLPDGDTEVRAVATDTAGNQSSVSAYARFAPEPSALDRDPSAAPLLVLRNGSGLRLAWQAAPGFVVNVYRGTIASLHRGAYDHAADGACGLDASVLDRAMPSDDSYFLVATSCGWGDSSLGRDSLGRERPQAITRCP